MTDNEFTHWLRGVLDMAPAGLGLTFDQVKIISDKLEGLRSLAKPTFKPTPR